MPTLRHLIIALVLPVLLSCAETGPEGALADYVARLQRTLDTTAEDREPIALPAPPGSRDLLLDLQPGNLGALDFLALRGCAVQANIGRRNSSLGRMAPPSQQLLLDLEYLRQAPACIDSLAERGEQALADNLANAAAVAVYEGWRQLGFQGAV